jgi:hypothetical protein
MEREMTMMNLDKLEVWVRAKDFSLVIYKGITTHAKSIGKQLKNYIAYLKRSKQGEKEFPAGYPFEKHL